MAQVEKAAGWSRIEDLFYAALALDSAERDRFLEENCTGDEVLRSEVESLLAFSGATMGVLKRPVESVAQSLALSEKPQELGPYRLIRLLGDGGMGQVYLAERSDHLYEQEVAIKLMRPGLKQSGAMLVRFSAERQILANLNHPNIARLLDAGITQEGAPFLVMEYVDGMAIDAYCRQNNLGIPAILKLFLAVCSAVEYAHKNLVIHRDIKPANILVDHTGVPKLLDFGIAKLLNADAEALTRMTERIMTPEYASPEQVRGEPVTTATDVYALGVLLFELLSGQRPFRLESRSPLEAIRVICELEPQAPSAAAGATDRSGGARVDRDLDNIVLMAMRKEPSRRYAGVAALSSDVRAYLAGYPVQARTDRWSYRSQKFIRRHKASMAAAVVVSLALVGFSIGMGVLAQRANRARITAQRETQFLNTIFQAATPDQARGKPVMARDLLDQGAKRIDSELAGQPELQATMLDNVGRAYTAIGMYGEASELLHRAFETRRRLLGKDSLDTASTEDAYATALRLEEQFAQADPYFRDALAIRRRKLGAHDRAVGESLSNLGECLYLEGRNQEAEPILREALAIDRRLNDQTTSGTRDYLALLLEREGNFPEAAQLLREAVDINRRVAGEDSPDYLVTLHNYAGALIDSGNLDAAEGTEREVLALRKKVSGPDHPDVFYSLNNLGFILLEKGEGQKALAILDEAVALCRKTGIEAKLANALGNRARAWEQKGDDAAAAEDLREALRLVNQASGQKSWILAKIIGGFGQLEFNRGREAASTDYARRALDMERALGGEETPGYASSLIDMGDALLFDRDAQGAEAAYRQAVEIRRKKFNAGNPNILWAEVRLGEALVAEGNTREAEPRLRAALASARQEQFPLPAWRVAEMEYALGTCLKVRGDSAEGEPLVRQSEHGLREHAERRFRWPEITKAIR